MDYINLNIDFKENTKESIVKYGDCVISHNDVYGIVQIDSKVLKVISLSDFNRKTDDWPNLYDKKISEILKLFDDGNAIYVKRNEYKLSFTNK